MVDDLGGSSNDVFDKSRLVVPVTVTSPTLPWPIDGYTNGKSFFLSEDVVLQLASILPERLRKTDLGWEETVQDEPRPLVERHIHGRTFYKFRKHWGFTLEVS